MRDAHRRMVTGIVIWVLLFSSVGIAASSRIPGPDSDDRATSGTGPVSEPQAGNPGSELRTGLALVRAERWSAAQSHLHLAAGADANVRKELVSLGEEAFSGARFNEALTLIDSVVDLVPDAAPLHSMAGACYYNLRNPALAVKEVQQAIRLKPENEDYYIQLAQVFIDYNTPEPAILLLEPAIRRFPSSARIRFVLGVAYLKASKFGQAQQCLKESLHIDPRNRLANHALAMASEGAEDWKGLVEAARMMRPLDGEDGQSYYYEAEAYYNLDRGHAARRAEIERLLKRSLEMNPQLAEGHLLMGKLRLESGAYHAAVESLNRATRIQPGLAAAYYNLGVAYERLGDSVKSSESFQQFRKVTQEKRDSEKSLRYEVVGRNER